MENYNEANNQHLDWDSVIENDNAFTLLPEGEYPFTVTAFSRSEHQPKDPASKIPACKCAAITLTVEEPASGATVEVNEKLFLLKKFEWKLCQFFTCIGQRKPGEQLRMNWATILGAKGRVRLEINRYTGNDGKPHENNRVAEYLEPKAAAQISWKPGSF